MYELNLAQQAIARQLLEEGDADLMAAENAERYSDCLEYPAHSLSSRGSEEFMKLAKQLMATDPSCICRVLVIPSSREIYVENNFNGQYVRCKQ